MPQTTLSEGVEGSCPAKKIQLHAAAVSGPYAAEELHTPSLQNTETVGGASVPRPQRHSASRD